MFQRFADSLLKVLIFMTTSLFPVHIFFRIFLPLSEFLLPSGWPDRSRIQERQLYSAVSNDGSECSQKHFGGFPTLSEIIAMSHNA